jgi:phospholipid-binding lipoprotein MlaA
MLIGFMVFMVVPEINAQASDVDPFITVNRNLYSMNEAFDEVVVKPITRGYDGVIPGFGKRGVSNFLNNLDDVNVVFNDLLQLKIKDALQDSSRLVINSTIGIAGLIDVASGFGLYKNNEDFGQTLGHWGVPSGPYIVVPFFGNSTVRDAIALIPDYLLNPVFWLKDDATRYAIYSLDRVDTRLYYLAGESMISGDEYTFVRDAFLQRREYLVADGVVYDEWDEF